MPDPAVSRPTGSRVAALISYPVKGCAGVSTTTATLTRAGLAHDRGFMVVDQDGVFRSQRRDPRLAVIRPAIIPDGTCLTLTAPGAGTVSVPVDSSGPRREVQLFGDRYRGIDQGDEVAGWLSDVLGGPSRLVRVPPEHDRVTNGETQGTTGYADGCAVHLLAVSSVDMLNERLREHGAEPLPATRFRPNIVVTGWSEPHTEDRLRRLRIGTAELAFAKVAIRCVVTTVDQRTGRRTGPEPLRTLATYRRAPGGVSFGANLAVTRPGELAVGDPLIVDQWAAPDRHTGPDPAAHPPPLPSFAMPPPG
ncbi:MOSC N-terminal beta barrel domain-containing protein [Solwaraspora sp. WMMD1047]|uniref:MOSC domain-containing protein n=1 Tax=Solwaraspora sp. WMMD1047 TaxID=3016102 RepID=UPI002415C870|nr:MOSC N-terminal beta barrel domain-containing protein [Solwaraspora sp. WMMD1047]MDG4829493.1 MOSC N-terminal beta barrel domain-containing protein [Solwaraspora sp. WMMD1047]